MKNVNHFSKHESAAQLDYATRSKNAIARKHYLHYLLVLVSTQSWYSEFIQYLMETTYESLVCTR